MEKSDTRMDAVFRYHRLQQGLPEILEDDKIISSAIELNVIALGTENGYVHVLGLDGQILKSVKAHDRPVNSVSIDGIGSTVARYVMPDCSHF